MAIAWLGTGLLGSGFVGKLRDRGVEVTAWNRTAAKAQALTKAGAKVAATAAEAVRGVERVHLCLSADEAVDGVLAEIVAVVDKDVVIVDHTTTSPAGTAARAAKLAAAGRPFLHAPVFMSPGAARTAKGLMLVAGPSALVERVAPELAPMTGELWPVGERSDLAAAYKLMGNAMLSAILIGLTDIFTMARALDIPRADCLTLFEHFHPINTLPARGAKMAQGDFAPSFALTMARKDLGLMADVAKGTDAPLTFIPALIARVDELIRDGHGADDLGVIAIDAVRR